MAIIIQSKMRGTGESEISEKVELGGKMGELG